MKKTPKRPTRSASKRKSQPRILLGRARFLPAILIAVFATVLSLQPHSTLPHSRQVLAYATNTSTGGLLSATNTQRNNNGASSLTANSKLQTAAQNKANDMVARNYWSHNTPDGEEPWVFIDAAGYSYEAAGENLAYGFMTSSDTVTGWMNSPPHRSNMLSNTFTEVGFGIANSANYVGDGPQTVVVAMYGKPLGASTPAPVQAAPTPAPAPKTAVQAAPEVAPAPVEEAPAPTPEPVAVAEEEVQQEEEEPIATATSESTGTTASAAPAEVKRIQLIGTGWLSAGAITFSVLAAGTLWLLHKGFQLRKFVISGEHFIMHHMHLDLTVLAVVYLGFVLLTTSGTVR